jgi:predicted AAA+ superfamily ATPase
LLRQTNESLAGRIAFLDLTPFLLSEIEDHGDWQTHWLRGGFPESFLARSDRDSGVLHHLLDVERYDDLLAHPVSGPSWEGYCIQNIVAAMPRHRPSFIRTSNGAEIDLVMERRGEVEVFEFKLSKSPRPSRGFHTLVKGIVPTRTWLVAPVDEAYDLGKSLTVIGLADLSRLLRSRG